MKKTTRSKLFALTGIVVAIVAALLIATYVSNNKIVNGMQYGNTIIHQPAAKVQ